MDNCRCPCLFHILDYTDKIGEGAEMKQGQFWDMKTIILMLVILVIMLFIAKGLYDLFIKQNPNACLLSVKATANTRGTPTDVFSLQCSTNFAGDFIAEGSSDDVKKKSLMLQTADLLETCWRQFGEGNYDVFSKSTLRKDAHCFVCSKFNLDKSRTDISVTQAEFYQYLKDTPVEGTPKKYNDYLYQGLLTPKDIDANNNVVSTGADPFIFIHKLDINYFADAGWIDKTVSTIEAIGSAAANWRALIDYWVFSSTKAESFPELQYNNGPYAVVYFQVSNQYLHNIWTVRLLQKLSDKTFSTDFYKIPPAYVMITEYDRVRYLGCDALQG